MNTCTRCKKTYDPRAGGTPKRCAACSEYARTSQCAYQHGELSSQKIAKQQRIAALRLDWQHGALIDDLCRQYGITPQTINRWAKGLTRPHKLLDLPEGSIRLAEPYADYAVDATGRVWTSKYKSTWRCLKARHNSEFGHLQVHLYGGKDRRQALVHHLVLEAFVGVCPPGMECRHLNGIPDDNRIENLAWGTSKENGEDMVKHGHSRRGIESSNSKLKEDGVHAIRSLLRAGVLSQKEIARRFGISNQAISDIKISRSWRWLKEK